MVQIYLLPNDSAITHSDKVYGPALYPEVYRFIRRYRSYCPPSCNLHLLLVRKLCQAGFFWTGDCTGKNKTKCFVSGCLIENWSEGDNPTELHVSCFPECGYASFLKLSPDSLFEIEDSPAVQVVLQLGLPRTPLQEHTTH